MTVFRTNLFIGSTQEKVRCCLCLLELSPSSTSGQSQRVETEDRGAWTYEALLLAVWQWPNGEREATLRLWNNQMLVARSSSPSADVDSDSQ